MYYFSALAHHVNPLAVTHHRMLIEAMKSTGVIHAELKHLADFSFKIKAEHYARHVFSDYVTTSGGKVLVKPTNW